MKMTKRTMMKSAHKITKLAIKKIDNTRDAKQDYATAFKFALKEVWYQAKKYNKVRFGKDAVGTASNKVITSPVKRKADYKEMYKMANEVEGIKRWIVEENLSNEELTAVDNYCNSHMVVRETAKAVQVKFMTDFGNITKWFPKSQLTEDFYQFV